jgi:predicted small lipoprotein YifL
MRRSLLLLSCLVAATLLAGCGYKGPLTPAPTPAANPAPAPAPAASASVAQP